MAIVKDVKKSKILKIGNTQIYVEDRENVVLDPNEEIIQLKKRQKETQEFYSSLVNVTLKEKKEPDKFELFLMTLKDKELQLFEEAKKLTISKSSDFIEYYGELLNNPKSFHFILINNHDFRSWYKNIVEFNFLKNSLDFFKITIDSLSTTWEFDVSEKWYLEAEAYLYNFLKNDLANKTRKAFQKDWTKAKEKYHRFMKNNPSFFPFEFKDE